MMMMMMMYVYNYNLMQVRIKYKLYSKDCQEVDTAVKKLCQILPSLYMLLQNYCKKTSKQSFQRLVIGWVTIIYYFELLRTSEGTLSRLSHLQSAPAHKNK
jgi:hypothetical protein